jgi:exonuclease SbcD
MPPVRLLHAADLHLDGPVAAPDSAGSTLTALADQARARSLSRLVKLAREQGTQVVLLSGDVFHTPRPPMAAVLLLQEALAAWTNAGARVFIAPGNHDPWQAGSVWEQWRPAEGVHIFTPQPQGLALEDLGLWVAGAAHDSSHVDQDLAARLPAPPAGLTGVACVHADLPASKQSDRHLPYAPTDLATLVSAGFAYWALGHWHKPQELCERPRVVMAGTPQGAHLDETGPHGAWLVEVDPGGGDWAKAEFMANAPLVFHDVVLNDLMPAGDPATLVEMARAAMNDERQQAEHQVCLRLALQGPCPLWQEFVGEWAGQGRAALKKGLVLAGLVLECGRLSPPVDAHELAQRDDVLGGLLRILDQAVTDDDLLAELEERLLPSLHPWPKGLDQAARRAWLRELVADAKSTAIRDLWLGGGKGGRP